MPLTLRLCVVFAFAVCLHAADKTVSCIISFPNAVHHEAEVRATFGGVNPGTLEVVISRSSPGRYSLHEFAKNIYHFRATDATGQLLPVTRPNPSGWNIATAGGTITVAYTVFGDRADGTYDGIDETHAHLNMPATLVWARGFEHAPTTLMFTPYKPDWKIATQLIPTNTGVFTAPDLEWLMDSPVEISDHAFPEWKIEDATFRLSLHHTGTGAQAAAYAKMCEAVVLEEEGVFGALPKYDGGTYTFLVDYLPYVNGDGMEHRDSTVITGTGNLGENSSRLIGTVSHEFFHSWNVKRIRPKSLEPFDFEHADMSGELWFAEGFTNYYGPLALKRAGLSSLSDFVQGMGNALNNVLTAPGRDVFNVVDMSRQAPFVDAATSIDPTNQINNFISYYTYGQALAFGIDLMVRQEFPGKSLDDWMRTMWREHPDIDKPYTLDDLQHTLGETVGDQAFATRIFEHHIYGKEPLPYENLVAAAGLILRPAHPGVPWAGSSRGFRFSDGPIELTNYSLRGSPLYERGLDKGDRIVQWDGKSFKSARDLDDWLARHKPGDTVSLKVTRREGSRDVQITLAPDPNLELVTYEDAGKEITPQIAAFRQAWLGSKALHPLPAGLAGAGTSEAKKRLLAVIAPLPAL